MVIYTVQNGDSLYSIAKRYGVSAESIQDDNLLEDPEKLTVGETIVITQPLESYVAKDTDDVYSVAENFGISVNELWRNNPVLSGEPEIPEGTLLKIKLPPKTMGSLSVNAYAYPSISREILKRTLPYLTFLTIFSYAVREDGSLDAPDDENLITLARSYGVAPVMHLSTLSSRGTFSTNLATAVLQNENIRQKIVQAVLDTLNKKGYVGIDVDFEYVAAENAEAFTTFLGEMKAALEPYGYEVWVALAPKVRADQPGVLYEGHNYRELGAIADKALLMTYEWGYTYGPAMAVSPLPQVRRVLEYALREIPAGKIFLGVPNYGYDWTLPYEAGKSRARSLGNVEAVDQAWEKRAAISYDMESQAPTYHYYETTEKGNAVEHEVWFEDGKSVEAMLSLAKEYMLYGIGVWNIMKYFPQLWTVLNSMYNIRKVLEGDAD